MKLTTIAFKWTAGALLGVGLGFATVISFPFIERALMYHPDRRVLSPEDVGADGFEAVWHERPGGVRVVSWVRPPRRPDAPTLFYLHGNGGHMGGRAGRITELTEDGAGLVIMSYRGYSGSGGKPSEAANLSDARAIFEASANALKVPMNRWVIFGESLGTAIATRLAEAYPVRGLVLDSPFTSMVATGGYHYPYLPVRWFLRDRYETDDIIGNVRVPILMLHHEVDAVVPSHMSVELARRATSPVTRHVIPGIGHVDHDSTGTMKVVKRWIAELPDPTANDDATTVPSRLLSPQRKSQGDTLRPSPAN